MDQEGVWEYLQDSVNSFVQGYNVSILAYGQSGAGKSYTMGTSGPAEQNDQKVMGMFGCFYLFVYIYIYLIYLDAASNTPILF